MLNVRQARNPRIEYSVTCPAFRMTPCQNANWERDRKGNRNLRMPSMIPRVWAAENVSVEKEKITTIHPIRGNQARLLVFADFNNDILLERDESLPAALANVNPVFLFNTLLVLGIANPPVRLPEGQHHCVAVHSNASFLGHNGVTKLGRQRVDAGSRRALLGEVENRVQKILQLLHGKIRWHFAPKLERDLG